MSCIHPVVVANMCAGCGSYVAETSLEGMSRVSVAGIGGSGVAFYSSVEIEARHRDVKREMLRRNHLLGLVLDLDETIVHARRRSFCKDEVSISDSPNIFSIGKGEARISIAVRPGFSEFIEALKGKFVFSVATLGSRQYANSVLELLDPTGEVFKGRVVAREDIEKHPGRTGDGQSHTYARVVGGSEDRRCAMEEGSTRAHNVYGGVAPKGVSFLHDVPSDLQIVVDDRPCNWPEECVIIQPPGYTYEGEGEDPEKGDPYLPRLARVLLMVWEKVYGGRPKDIRTGGADIETKWSYPSTRAALSEVRQQILMGAQVYVTKAVGWDSDLKTQLLGMGADIKVQEHVDEPFPEGVTHVVVQPMCGMARREGVHFVTQMWVFRCWLWFGCWTGKGLVFSGST